LALAEPLSRESEVIAAFGPLVWLVVLRVYEVSEQIDSIWTEQGETISPLSGDGISLNLFALIIILRKETLVFCRHQRR